MPDILTLALPQPTKQYLFNLITSPNFASNQPFESFTQNPDGIAGNTRKFAWQPGMPTGGGGAGALRLLKHVHNDPVKVVWFRATHTPGNTYRFDRIIIPACTGCRGTADILCPSCQGFNVADPTLNPDPANRPPGAALPAFWDKRPCTVCNRRGVIRCPTCTQGGLVNPQVVDGRAVSRNFAQW